MKKGDLFPKRQSLHGINDGTTAQVGTAFFDIQHRRSGKDHLQVGVVIVDEFQFPRPVVVFMNFIDD